MGGLEVVICPALLAEVEDVLGRPRIQKRVEPELARLYVATVRRIADVAADPESVVAETRDPDDDYLVALARNHASRLRRVARESERLGRAGVSLS